MDDQRGTDDADAGESDSYDDCPDTCPECGSTDVTALYKQVTSSVTELDTYACTDCDWSGLPPWTCGGETTDGSQCELEVAEPDQRCAYHPKDGDSDVTTGAPRGNDNAVGNDGGAPQGNTNSLKTGQYQSLKRRLDMLDDDQRQRFETHYTDFMTKAENKGAAVALATAEVLRESIADRLLEADQQGGLWETIPVTDDTGDVVLDPRTGEPVTRERLRRDDIDALKSLMSELRLGKKYEGINDNQNAGSQGHGNAQTLWGDTDTGDLDLPDADAADST